MYCTYCAKEFGEEDRFCSACGGARKLGLSSTNNARAFSSPGPGKAKRLPVSVPESPVTSNSTSPSCASSGSCWCLFRLFPD